MTTRIQNVKTEVRLLLVLTLFLLSIEGKIDAQYQLSIDTVFTVSDLVGTIPTHAAMSEKMVVAGQVSNGQLDVFFKGIGIEGNELWEYVFSGSSSEFDKLEGISRRRDGGVVGAVNTALFVPFSGGYGPFGNEVNMVCLDIDGNPNWVYKYKEDGEYGWVTDFKIDEDDNTYVIGGSRDSLDLEFLNSFLFKLSSEGELLWIQKGIRGGASHLSLNNGMLSVLSNSEDDFYIADFTIDGDFSGIANFTHQYGTFFPERYSDNDGNIYLVKLSQGYGLTKYSQSGSFLWTYERAQPVDTNIIDRIEDIDFDEDGNVYLSGSFYTAADGSAIQLVKISPDGNIIWENRIAAGAGSLVWPNDIEILHNELYIGGNAIGAGNSRDAILSVCDIHTGDLLYDTIIVAAPGMRNYMRNVEVDDSRICIAGATYVDISESSLLYKEFVPLVSSNSSVLPINNYLKIYPNPATDFLHVESRNVIKSVVVSSTNGTVLGNYDNPGRTIDVNHLKSGSYLIRIDMGEQGVLTRKFVKM